MKKIIFILPLFLIINISAVTLDGGVVLNTTSSNSSMTFNFPVTANEILIESYYIFLDKVNYTQEGVSKGCDFINYSEENSNLDSSNFSCTSSPVSSSRGSGGGGGGGSFNINWGCKDWSNCMNGTQTRECESTYGKKKIEEKPCFLEKLINIKFGIEGMILKNFNQLVALIKFENLKTEDVPVYLSYIILNESENEIYSEEDSLILKGKESHSKRFWGPNLPTGNYTFILKVIYENEIKENIRKEFEIKGYDIFWLWIFMITLLALFIVYSFVKLTLSLWS